MTVSQSRRRLLTSLSAAGAMGVLVTVRALADFVHKYPVATKHVRRAILKTIDICAAEPEWAARRLVEGAFTQSYDLALQTLTEVPYGKWREYDPEDSLRFYALRLHEVGLIKSSPNAILPHAIDWRSLDELKLELKT